MAPKKPHFVRTPRGTAYYDASGDIAYEGELFVVMSLVLNELDVVLVSALARDLFDEAENAITTIGPVLANVKARNADHDEATALEEQATELTRQASLLRSKYRGR